MSVFVGIVNIVNLFFMQIKVRILSVYKSVIHYLHISMNLAQHGDELKISSVFKQEIDLKAVIIMTVA